MNSHLTHQQLLAYLDGELPKGEMRRTKVHLHSCWTCRIEMKRLESDIATILDSLNEEFSPALPPPTRSWVAFDTLLARSLPARPDSLWEKLAAYTNPFFGPARILVTSCVLVTLAIFAYSMFRSKPVSAKEVLRQIHIADARRSSIAKGEVLRERVSIRKNTRRRGTPQLEEVDAWESRTAAYWNNPDGDSAAAELEAHYKAHNVPIDLPLSAASVECWGKAAGGNPTASRDGEDIDLIFAGSEERTKDPIERVSLRIQPESWQVKQMTLQFPDASFEVTEDDFSLLPISAVPVELLAHLEPPVLQQILVRHVVKARSVSEAASIAMHPQAVALDAVNLDAVELDVFATLHQLNADLGEPVTVTRSSRAVQVGVWQLPPDRRVELSAVLQGKPGVQVQTSDPVHFAAARKVVTEALPLPPSAIAPGSEDQDQRLLKFFGSAEQKEAFTRQVLATSTTILSHLYALRNLQDQFSPPVGQALPPNSRLQLTTLVEDHAAAIATGLDAMVAQLAPLNTAFNIPTSGLPATPDVASWQDGSIDALETAKVVDHLLRSLLTTSQTPISPDTALPQIQQNLSRLGTDLSELRAAAR